MLLVTSRRSKRWIIPKGRPIKGLKPAQAAAREAYAEADVRGKVGREFGYFLHDKHSPARQDKALCEVRVFPLAAKRQLKK